MTIGHGADSSFLAVSPQVTLVIKPVVCCHYFPPRPWLLFQPKRSPPWPVQNYTAWWQKHTGVAQGHCTMVNCKNDAQPIAPPRHLMGLWYIVPYCTMQYFSPHRLQLVYFMHSCCLIAWVIKITAYHYCVDVLMFTVCIYRHILINFKPICSMHTILTLALSHTHTSCPNHLWGDPTTWHPLTDIDSSAVGKYSAWQTSRQCDFSVLNNRY